MPLKAARFSLLLLLGICWGSAVGRAAEEAPQIQEAEPQGDRQQAPDVRVTDQIPPQYSDDPNPFQPDLNVVPPLALIDRSPKPGQEVDGKVSSLVMAFDRDLDPKFGASSVVVTGCPNWKYDCPSSFTVPGKTLAYGKALVFFPNLPLKTDGTTYGVKLYGGEGGPRAADGGWLPNGSYWEFKVKFVPPPPDYSWACSGRCFGAFCQDNFEKDWQKSFQGYACAEAGHFVSQMDDIATKEYFTDLESSKVYFESWDHQHPGGLDTVDLAYVFTHGTTNSNNAFAMMWDEGVFSGSASDNWRFGDTNTKLAFLALHACGTLKVDEYAGARWANAFRGGLLMALGSHGILWAGATDIYNSREFAKGLQNGKSAKWAWYDGLAFADVLQDVAVMASGSTTAVNSAAADCAFRRDDLTWQNFGGFTRWRDSQVEHLCMSWIDNY